jgi:hypothetical protein
MKFNVAYTFFLSVNIVISSSVFTLVRMRKCFIGYYSKNKKLRIENLCCSTLFWGDQFYLKNFTLLAKIFERKWMNRLNPVCWFFDKMTSDIAKRVLTIIDQNVCTILLIIDFCYFTISSWYYFFVWWKFRDSEKNLT